MKASKTAVVSQDGFRGYFYESNGALNRCIIVVAGDEGNDFMDRLFAKWLTQKQNCHALCIAVRQKPEYDTGLHSWPLEHIKYGVQWLKARGMKKIGILGMSMQGSMALSAAARIPDLSLVIGLAPNDFVPWGFFQGRMGNIEKGEWPSETSAFSWRGTDLPYQPSFLEKEAYWEMYCSEKKKYREMHTITLFEHSESCQPVPEACFIPVESIRGKLILIGAEDDTMWNTSKYIHRMEQRLRERKFSYPVETHLYPYGTHLLVPEGVLRIGLPLLGDLVSRMFVSGKTHAKECRQARIDVEHKVTAALRQW